MTDRTEYMKKWRADNAERIKQYSREYHQKNKDRENQKSLDYYYTHRERRLEQHKEWLASNPDKTRKHAADYRARTKKLVLDAYGTVCQCCGEDHPKFLTIDHINGCTPEQRKKEGGGSVLYQYLKTHGFPKGYQTLCFNCNRGRATNGGVCPHQE